MTKQIKRPEINEEAADELLHDYLDHYPEINDQLGEIDCSMPNGKGGLDYWFVGGVVTVSRLSEITVQLSK